MTKAKKRSVIVIALVALLALTVFQSLAYFKESQVGEKAVKNTFIAAGGGLLVDNTDSVDKIPTQPGDLDMTGMNKNFFLVEKKANYSNGAYTAPGPDYVLQNRYEKAVPGMIIPKDPTLTLNLVEGAEAYVFVKITDATKGNILHTVDDTKWVELSSVTGLGVGEKLYCYKEGTDNIVKGKPSTKAEIDYQRILKNNQVTVKGELVAGGENVGQDGALGDLKFEAYVCQARGFTDATTAFEACFGSN